MQVSFSFPSLGLLDAELRSTDENLIDLYGKPYIQDESWPAGGGLDKRCSYNGDALHAYYTLKSRYEIFDYLKAVGFELNEAMTDREVWSKGNTEITFEVYDWSVERGFWAYLHTEYIG